MEDPVPVTKIWLNWRTPLHRGLNNHHDEADQSRNTITNQHFFQNKVYSLASNRVRHSKS